jgi:hypothetical protein
MPSLDDLPTELINNVSTSLECADILAMHYADRKLSFATPDAFFRSFVHVTVSCSHSGLRRLEALAQQQDAVQAIKQVTLHTLTFKPMADMAGLLLKDEPNPATRVYADMRETLVRCLNQFLNQFLNLEVITATNESLDGSYSDHAREPSRSSKLDHLNKTRSHRRLYQRSWKPLIIHEKTGFTHGYVVILSVLPALQKHVKFNLTIDYTSFGPGRAPFYLSRPARVMQSSSNTQREQQCLELIR